MKRVSLLVVVALVLASAMALSGVAQAAPIGGTAYAKCAKLAIKTLGPGFDPSNYTFVGGTDGTDDFTGHATSEGPEVFCGFGGDDSIDWLAPFNEGAVFLGGDGNDQVLYDSYGTFYGGAGNDSVGRDNEGTFYGQEGDDSVSIDRGGTFVQ